MRDILAWRFQIADDDSVDGGTEEDRRRHRAAVRARRRARTRAEAHAHLLGHLIGIEWKDSRAHHGHPRRPQADQEPRLPRRGAALPAVSAADGAPVVLQLEDLHWADGESLDFLNYLAEVNRDVPLLRAALHAADAVRAAHGLACAAKACTSASTCSRSTRTRAALLADELLKKLPEIPAALSELVTGSAEGNPFYMEELVKMLIDQGAIGTTGEPWRSTPNACW